MVRFLFSLVFSKRKNQRKKGGATARSPLCGKPHSPPSRAWRFTLFRAGERTSRSCTVFLFSTFWYYRLVLPFCRSLRPSDLAPEALSFFVRQGSAATSHRVRPHGVGYISQSIVIIIRKKQISPETLDFRLFMRFCGILLSLLYHTVWSTISYRNVNFILT